MANIFDNMFLCIKLLVLMQKKDPEVPTGTSGSFFYCMCMSGLFFQSFHSFKGVLATAES